MGEIPVGAPKGGHMALELFELEGAAQLGGRGISKQSGMPPAGIEPAAYRLGGGRSIH